MDVVGLVHLAGQADCEADKLLQGFAGPNPAPASIQFWWRYIDVRLLIDEFGEAQHRDPLLDLTGVDVLCKVYLFSAPLTGISISLACYVASICASAGLSRSTRPAAKWGVGASPFSSDGANKFVNQFACDRFGAFNCSYFWIQMRIPSLTCSGVIVGVVSGSLTPL
jgi:hypothetical protein